MRGAADDAARPGPFAWSCRLSPRYGRLVPAVAGKRNFLASAGKTKYRGQGLPDRLSARRRDNPILADSPSGATAHRVWLVQLEVVLLRLFCILLLIVPSA